MTLLVPVPANASGYLRAGEAGVLLGLRSADVFRLIDQGRLTGYRRDRFVVFAVDEVEALARADGGSPAPDAPA